MLKGIEIDQNEAQREIIRGHQHFVNALKLNKRNYSSLEGTISTRAETKRSEKPPVYKNMKERQNEADEI